MGNKPQTPISPEQVAQMRDRLNSQPVETIPPRPTLREEAERLLTYWELHQGNPEAVAKWLLPDMLGILRYIVEEG